MLGIDPRAARAAWTVFLIALLVATAYTIRVTLVVFMIALLFAYLLTPVVDLVQRFTPKAISPRSGAGDRLPGADWFDCGAGVYGWVPHCG